MILGFILCLLPLGQLQLRRNLLLLVNLPGNVVAQHYEEQKDQRLVQLQEQIRPTLTRRVVIHIFLVDSDCTHDLDH